MTASKNSSNNPIRAAQRECQLRGFVKCGTNWYRHHGQGLLQVVTLNGLPQRTTDIHYQNKPTASFIVYSMYEHIPWINVPIMRARRDLIPNVSAGVFAHQSAGAPFLGAEFEAKNVIDLVLPFLDELNSHAQLAGFLEDVDRWEYGKIRLNDRNKIVPYLLSGKWQDALSVIDAIEKQNQQAYQQNCKTVKGYDPISQKQRIDENLEPLVSLRNNILSHNAQGIIDLLLANFQKNKRRLEDMDIPIPDHLPFVCDFLDLDFH